MSARDQYYVYILLCADMSYYVGVTNDYERRLDEHETAKKETAYTASWLPVKLVYLETHLYINNAILRDKNLKTWSHAKKTALINGDMKRLRELSKKRIGHAGKNKLSFKLSDRVEAFNLFACNLVVPRCDGIET